MRKARHTRAHAVEFPAGEAALRFQAEALVTQKLQNRGFNCVASAAAEFRLGPRRVA